MCTIKRRPLFWTTLFFVFVFVCLFAVSALWRINVINVRSLIIPWMILPGWCRSTSQAFDRGETATVGCRVSRAAAKNNVHTTLSSIPYHTIRAAEVEICHEQRWGQLRWPNGQALQKWEGRIGSVSRCAATATFCWQCVCVVCAREKEGRLKGLCLLFYELGFSESVHCL